MSIFSSLFGWLGWSGDDLFNSDAETSTSPHEDSCFGINPATGLPIVGCSHLDVQGNPYGINLSQHDHWPSCDAGTSMDTNPSSPFSVWDD
jgi:hypothetical protein